MTSLSGYYNCDSASIRLRRKMSVHFFVASRSVVSNKAVVGAYNDVIVYATVIRMTFTLTDQHRIASFSLSTLV